MSDERQSTNAIRFYESRSTTYDATWHDDFTTRFLSYLDLQPGQEVLDLACGTGLLTFKEADTIGPTGKFVGIDVTPGMLAIASQKKEKAGDKYANVELYEGDILHLDETQALAGRTFDVITVASALVLLPDPKAAIEHWSTYLNPGGKLVLDSTHPRNLVPGIVLERVARRLNLSVPYNRCWSRSESALQKVLESAGLDVERVTTVHNQAGYGKRYYDIDQWDDFFVENVIVKDVTRTFANNDVRRKAQKLYKEEWEKLAVDGKVEEVDAVFLAVARKPTHASTPIPTPHSNKVIFKGSCRCAAVQYTSTSPPSPITLCHCRACQHLSGSAYLPFTHIPKSSFKFTSSATLTTLHLSASAERTFCSRCGTPLTMAYSYDEDEISVTMGSVDVESLACEVPRVGMHIYLAEKAPWLVLPDDDGTERWGTMRNAHLVKAEGAEARNT